MNWIDSHKEEISKNVALGATFRELTSKEKKELNIDYGVKIQGLNAGKLKSLGLFFSDTVSQNVYNEFKQRKINIGGYNLALGNQIVPYFFKGISKPVFVAGIQKGGVEMYEGEIYNDSLKNLRTRVIQNSFLNYNFRPGFVMVPCDVTKPIFNTSKSPGLSLK